MYATVRIDLPSRYVNVVVPVEQGTAVGEFFLVGNGGERVLAQQDVVARYADGSPQAIQLWGHFPKSRPAVVSVEVAPEGQTYTPFEWTANTVKAWRWFQAGATSTKNSLNGHVVKRVRHVTNNSVTWYTVFSGSDCIRVDKVLHNAHVWAAPQALDNVNLGVPLNLNYDVIPVIEEPLLAKDGFIVPDEKSPFYMPQRARRIFRLIFAPAHLDMSSTEVQDVHHAHGWGAATDAWQGSNAFTAIQMRVPDFGTINVAGRQASDYSTITNAIHNGTEYPKGTVKSVRLGLLHPASVPEGGMTGGWRITQCPGVDVAATGSYRGLMFEYHMQRMITDRCHIGILERTGEPATLEDYDAIPGWKMRSDDARFDKGPGSTVLDGPFGFSQAAPLPAGLCPDQPLMDAFEPMDWGHLIRSLGSNVTLAWLANDPISAWLIKQDAELARMSWFHGRIWNDRAYVDANPGKGCHYSRIHGWMLRVMAEAYALHGDQLRKRHIDHLSLALDICKTAQMEGSDSVQCDTFSKQFTVAPYNGQYGTIISIHTGILGAGIWAASLSIDYKWDWDFNNTVEFLRMGSNTLWSAAVRPVDITKPVFTTRQTNAAGEPLDSSHPLFTPSTGADFDNEQTRSILGLEGMHGDPVDRPEVRATILAMLGTNPTQKLLSMGLSATDSDAILLAYCQQEGL